MPDKIAEYAPPNTIWATRILFYDCLRFDTCKEYINEWTNEKKEEIWMCITTHSAYINRIAIEKIDGTISSAVAGWSMLVVELKWWWWCARQIFVIAVECSAMWHWTIQWN